MKSFEQWFAELFALCVQIDLQLDEDLVRLQWMYEDNLTPAEALQEAIEEMRKF